MPLATSNVLQCPSLQFSRKNAFLSSSVPNLPPSVVRFGRTSQLHIRLVWAASSAAGSSSSEGNFNPYEVLGVSPVAGFEVIREAYARRRKDAQERKDLATAAQLEEAYDKVMMTELENRKKGVTSGSSEAGIFLVHGLSRTRGRLDPHEVPNHIKYADKQPIVPWWPRFTQLSLSDMLINLTISLVFIAWILIQRNADYKPLEFLFFAFAYRIYEKLRQFEPPTKPKYTEDGEEEGRVVRMGKRLIRSLGLVVSCILVSSFGYVSILKVLKSVYKHIPAFVFYNQELFVTVSSAIMLFFMASFYR